MSESAGFGGRIRMRKMAKWIVIEVVIATGKSGAVPSYFDSAIGGLRANSQYLHWEQDLLELIKMSQC